MKTTKTATICSIVLALAALPGALGAWSANGGIEPDYAGDVDAGLMFDDPDINGADGHRQVYFNVIKTVLGSNANPNVGALGSHTGIQAQAHPTAFLGVWKDCNRDGYIGVAETALLEYSSVLLPDDDTCVQGGLFNRDGWVYEFVWIVDPSVGDETWRPARYIEDASVKVWGDPGLPPRVAPQPGGGDGGCYINFARGTFSSTGGLLDYADCITGHAVTAAVNDADEGTLHLGIGFGSDDNPQCSESPLNQQIGLFEPSPECPDRFPGYAGLLQSYEDHEHATFTAWDCDNAGPAEGVPTASPRVGESPGSAYEAANETYARCQSDGLPFVSAESDVEQSSARVTNEYVLRYYDSLMSGDERSGAVCDSDLPDSALTSDGCTSPLLSEDTPQAGGVYYGIPFLAGPAYWANTGTTHPGSVRNVETRDDGGVDGEGPLYDTYYARVTAPGLVLPGGSGVYGAEWCGSDFTSDRVLGGYDCNAAHWYNPLHGASAMPTGANGRPLGALPGETYNLRDTDCYDGSLAGQYAPGVGIGLTLLDAQPDEEAGPTGPCGVA